MTFWQHLFATFFGSVAGFVFGLVLHHYSEQSKTKKKNGQLLKGLMKEFQFNFSLLDNWIEDTELVLRKVGSDDHQIYLNYRLTDFQRLFTQMCFQQGILYDRLRAKDLANLNAILVHFEVQTTQFLNYSIAGWNNGEVPKINIGQIFEFELSKLKEHKGQLQELLGQLSKD